ncbi:MAG: helix-turn-helix transcriptional regulator [Lachnospiraceae bacterium]|nr:helix-turn-helix transcriptional regulator [Lachnospiraceae bacterium]
MDNVQSVEYLIGQRIQKIRKSKKYTQLKFAEMVGISTNYLSDIERGKSSVKLEKLVTIINALGCSADDVFADVVDQSYKVVGSKLTERIDTLSMKERDSIYALMEKVIDVVKK